VLHPLLAPNGAPRTAITAAVLRVLLGWSIFLFLPLVRRDGHAGDIPRVRAHALIAAALVASTIVVLVAGTYLVDHWSSIDEVVYSLQAHLFAQRDYRWHLDPDVQRFFTLPLMAPTPEGPYTQYPPGYPAILAVFMKFGAASVSGAILGAIAVASTYLLGRRCASPFVGVIAAAMLATHFLFLGFSARYLSHIAAMAAIVSAAWLVLTPSDASARRRAGECVLAGFLIGVAVTIRPVTGIALGLSLYSWLLSRRGWKEMRDTTLLLGIGMAIPIAALMLFNSYSNGSPFRLGYNAAQGHLNDLGFGTRGLVLYDARGQRVFQTESFGIIDALRYEARAVIWPLMRDATPVFTALPLIAIAYAYRLRFRGAAIAAFAVLPLVYFFYFDNGERMHLELLPFIAVGVALIVSRVWESDASAGRALTIFLLGASVASSATSLAAAARERTRAPGDGAVVMRELAAARRTNGPLLVFVRNPPLAEPLFIALSPLNFSPFPGPIVVARDLGSENASLICRMPHRAVMIAEAATAGHGARVLPARLDPASRAHCRAPIPSLPSPIH